MQYAITSPSADALARWVKEKSKIEFRLTKRRSDPPLLYCLSSLCLSVCRFVFSFPLCLLFPFSHVLSFSLSSLSLSLISFSSLSPFLSLLSLSLLFSLFLSVAYSLSLLFFSTYFRSSLSVSLLFISFSFSSSFHPFLLLFSLFFFVLLFPDRLPITIDCLSLSFYLFIFFPDRLPITIR